MTENEQKADLMKKALTIVDELGKLDDDLDYWEFEDHVKIEELVKQSKNLKKDGLWKLN